MFFCFRLVSARLGDPDLFVRKLQAKRVRAVNLLHV